MQHRLFRPLGMGLAVLSAILVLVGLPASTQAESRALPALRDTRWQAFKHKDGQAPVAATQTSTTPAVTTQSMDVINKVFDLSALSPEQATWATDVVASSCDYDWNELAAHLNGRKVKIEIANPPARGMFYPAELRVEVHKFYYRTSKTQASRILAWELAHAVDIYTMTDAQRQQVIGFYDTGTGDAHEWLTGPYEEQVGEAFMEGFVSAFCSPLSVRSNYFSHVTTPEVGQSIRQLLI